MSTTHDGKTSTQWLYVTAGSAHEAQTLAQTLVGERLAACANVLGGIQSYYWWNGAVQNDAEVALILKTRREKTSAAIQRIKELHSYDCPCVVALDIREGNPEFLEWIAQETA